MIAINHTEYQKRIKSLPIAALQFIIVDCNSALKVNPTGAKAGYYADEIHYAAMELQERKKL